MTETQPRPAEAPRSYLPIGDYGAIGDGRTLALVGSDGAIDWMCLPDLDSPSVFAALLDADRGGRFLLRPRDPFETERRYVEQTNVLETVFRTDTGRVRVTDALTLDASQDAPWRELARRIEPLEGEVEMRWQFDPRPGFGAERPRLQRVGEATVARCGKLQLGLQSWGAPRDETGLAGTFVAREGAEPAWLVLTAVTVGTLPLPGLDAVRRRFADTPRVWRDWVTRHSYEGPWREAVERSLLAIRLLADGRTGAIAAAGTTSLPEVIAGSRNYDYRFGWVRDASFTLESLLAVGMEELTHSALTWLLDAVARTHPRVDPVYGLDTRVIRSQEAIGLPGYRDTHPVNLGNQAGSQLQLGGFGDLLETVHAYVGRGHALSPELGERLADCADLLCHIWRHEDAGLWELSQSAQYGTSKLGCWTAFDRLLDLVERGQAPARHLERWRAERDALATFLEHELVCPRRGAWLQKAGSDALDCGMLLAARRGFGDPKGERMAATIDAIRSELGAGDGLLYRYSGMPEQENAFLACSFWMVEALALAGRLEEASETMAAVVGKGSDLGLFSEELVPASGELRGNFPQALTHLSLINAAATLERCAGSS